MYGSEDIREARNRLRKCTIILLSVPLALLVAYIMAIIAAKQALMLAALLAAFLWLMLVGDLIWLPAKRYAGFLHEMNKGLRRSTLCIPERIEAEAQLQDGAYVHALHVRLPDSGDSRIYYVNQSKLSALPPMGEKRMIISYGRHVVDWETVKE